MITEEQSMQMILEKYPGVKKIRENYIAHFGSAPPGFCIEMSIFSDYVLELLKKNEEGEKLKEIFNFLERLMREGTSDLQDAAATCCLENLVNASDRDHTIATRFVPLLGKESKEYCKAWDEFCKAKTPGLWGDEHEKK